MNFIKNELSGWKASEIAQMLLSCLIITSLSIYWHDSVMGIISSLAGVMYVLCTGKGKLSAYIFGTVNSVLYAIIAFKSAYYGETMLNILYYLPMQFVGFRVWSKNMSEQTHEVNKRHMQNHERLITLLIIIILTYFYGLFLRHIGDTMPFIDSFTTVASVIAMIVTIKMYSEQWWIWFAVNLFSVYMWWVDFSAGYNNIATLIMWMLYLVNGIILLLRWEIEIYNSKTTEEA